MSSSNNNATSLVPILDGTNYRTWAVAMKAYIMSTGMWAYAKGDVEYPNFPVGEDGKAVKITDERRNQIRAAQADFDKQDGIVLGQIMLRLHLTVQQAYIGASTAHGLWSGLEKDYGKSTAATVFKDFKDCLGGQIYENTNPTAYFNYLFAAFGRMKAADIEVPNPLQAMIALAALSKKWEMLVTIIVGDNDIDELELLDVRTTILNQWQLESICHGSGKHNTNKISTVKCKHGSPGFNQQQGGQQQHQN